MKDLTIPPFPATTIPVLGLIAYGSNTGKTTLLKKIIPLLKAKGVRPALLKHVHCGFDIDTPGKDSYELRQAGAAQVLVASGERWALMKEDPQADDYPDLASLVRHIQPDSADLILVEGFKEARHAKIELHRQATGNPCLFANDPTIIAVATDNPSQLDTKLPLLDLNDPSQVVTFICDLFPPATSYKI